MRSKIPDFWYRLTVDRLTEDKRRTEGCVQTLRTGDASDRSAPVTRFGSRRGSDQLLDVRTGAQESFCQFKVKEPPRRAP